MNGSRISILLLLAQFAVLVMPNETQHRQERQAQAGVVAPGKGHGKPTSGNNPNQGTSGKGTQPGQETPNNPNGGRPGIPGMPDPGPPPDTRGTEFIFCFTSNMGNALPKGLMLLIGAGGPTDTTVMISVPALRFARQLVIGQGLTETVDIPPRAAARGSGLQNGTIWIRANRPITVHGVNMQLKSNDGFLAIPVIALGLEYFVASYMASGAERSQVLITGTQDFTRLQILPSQRIMYNGQWFNIGATILLTINRMQSVQIQTVGDLTGTRINADKPVSVMSGCTCSLVPEQLNRCDHLVENIPPVDTWGKKFSLLPFRNRTTGHVFRVIAARPRTRFYTMGQIFFLAREGLFREFNQPLTFPLSIVTNKPVLVVQYAKGGALDRNGDPFMTIVPPVEQYIAGGVTFSSFDKSGTDKFNSFISISVTSWDLFNIFVNNDPLLSHDYTSSQEDWMRVVTFDADYQMDLKPGANTIVSPAPFSRFTAIAYGFTLGTSYAFPVAYGLRRLLCTSKNTADGEAETDCTGPIISGIVLSSEHGTGLGIQPPRHPQAIPPGTGSQPGWGNFNPRKTGHASEGVGGGDAGVFFPWYTIPPWKALEWEYDEEEDEEECYSPGLLVLSIIAPATIVFLVMLIIICAILFRRPGGTSKY